MKSIALLPVVLLLFGCTSSTDVIDRETLSCGPGQPLEIQAGVQGTRGRTVVEAGEEVVFLVEVANNSHEDVIIESVRIDPDRAGRSSGAYDPVYRAVNQEIAQGKDFLFEFPSSRRMLTGADDPRVRGASQTPSEMVVTVIVKGGDAYRCSFSLGR